MAKCVVAIGTLLAFLGSSAIASAEELFQAVLSGDQEVPAVDTNTTGRFKILVNQDATAGRYTLSVASGVRITHRLTDSPACLVSDEFGMSTHLERMLKAAGQPVPQSIGTRRSVHFLTDSAGRSPR